MPYLGRFGLVVTGICYVLGVALLCLVARAFFAPGYEAPPILLGLTTLVTLALVVALAVLPRKARQSVRENSAPHPWMVLLIIGIGGFIWHTSLFLWHIQPVFSRWPFVLVPMLSAAALLTGIAWLGHRWSQAHDWSDLHLLALVSGALAYHTLAGLLSLDLTHTLADRIALIALALAMASFLTWFAFRVRCRVARHDCTAKETEATFSVSNQ